MSKEFGNHNEGNEADGEQSIGRGESLGNKSGEPTDVDPALVKLRRRLGESSLGTSMGVHERDQGKAETQRIERDFVEGFIRDVFPRGNAPKPERKPPEGNN